MLRIVTLSLQGTITHILNTSHEDHHQYEVMIDGLHDMKAAVTIEQEVMDVDLSMRLPVRTLPALKSLMLRPAQGLAVQQIQDRCILIVSGSQ